MPRAIWSGSISFGLLNVPVKLYSAVSSQRVSFRELREGDGSRVRHKRVAEEDGKEVPYEKIVKGYEISPDQYDGVIPEDGVKPEKREVEMAKRLIDSLATDFEPDKYRDEYREELLALIERKAKGEAIVTQPTEEPKPTKAPDLMAALEESLAAVRGEELAEGAEDGAKERKPAKPASKAKSSGSKGRAKSKSKSSSSSRSKSGSGGRRKSPAKSR